MYKEILLVNKPKNMTSHDVCAVLKRKYKSIKKIGHAGTLDPMATGLLILGINSGTKLLGNLILEDKEYEAEIKFGIQTDTYDAEGKIINKSDAKVSKKQIVDYIDKYKNSTIMQTPPIYSSIKINGKKLYEYARKNEVVEIPKREVKIFLLELISFDEDNQLLKVKLNVSKGFYVRSFANDIGIELNTFAYLTGLNRTKSGNFLLDNSKNLDDILNDEKNLEI